MTMKYCLAIGALLLSHFSQSQVRVGVKGGLNFNKPVGKDRSDFTPGQKVERYDLHTDFHAGLTADIPVTKHFHIRPDLLFSRRVAEYDYKRGNTENGLFYYEKLNADYIELPVQFVYYHQFRHLALYLGGGPYVGFALSGKGQNRGGEFSRNGLDQYIAVYSNRQDDWYSKTSFGAVMSAGIDLPFGLTGELSVHRGFSNENNKSRLLNNGSKLINFNYGVSVGYLLGRKRT